MNALVPIVPANGALVLTLPEIADYFAANSKSLATRRAYRADWKAFTGWCRQHGHEPLPASPEAVRQHIACAALDGLAVSSIGRRVAAIRAAHEAAGVESPCAHKRVREELSGIRRTIGTAPTRKAPITDERLKELLQHLSPGLIGLRDRALLSLGFAGAFRRSELVALEVADLTEVADGLRVLIRRSKTDKTGEGQEIAIPRGYRLRPVEAVQTWLEAAQITEGPLFRRVRLGGVVGADLAVLTAPDGQAFYKQAKAYEELAEAATPLPLGRMGKPGPVHLLSLDRTRLVAGEATPTDITLWVKVSDGHIQGGMSGSPVVTSDGLAVSLVSTSSGTGELEEHTESGPSPLLAARLPVWLVPRRR